MQAPAPPLAAVPQSTDYQGRLEALGGRIGDSLKAIEEMKAQLDETSVARKRKLTDLISDDTAQLQAEKANLDRMYDALKAQQEELESVKNAAFQGGI